eukprot:CAMPEP_0197650228 /NCGR_PEP_ID=MMETSP1338-20131121/30809_1 /TAXON_ID=43686 ORGANISM="Pelagodinium beii, Strain RCC1491" /NCGR_SAMPLE_ID=MMETSP1338 /ASSEMBLY_ACC=CAM_ASM_000754 /LENGTH=682 /DNA_ID=CAMNT_0043224585 /DNA_START=88 /DNA_END=2136 /DNA_ORIENTATION=+
MPNVEASLPTAAPRVVPGNLRGRLETQAAKAGISDAASNTWSATLAAATVAGAAAWRAGQRRGKASRARPVALRVATLDRPATTEREDVRNIAIIAHVDHGKTTLTNALMKECGMQETKSMDSNQLEQERGITILAKNASVTYKGIKVNIVDTPGHADFGGEVERILNMADACLLLVDAQEGPMPQTKFVLRQALKLKKKLIVCINKVDKPASRPDWVLDTTFDLFASMGADDETCDFPVVYASGFNGVSSRDSPDKLEEDLKPLLDTIIEECPPPKVDAEAPLQMLVSNLDYDDYVGRICIGRIVSGSIKVGSPVSMMFGEDGKMREATVSKLWDFRNNERSETEEVKAGDICAFAGTEDVQIGDTVVDKNDPRPLPPIIVEEPTVAMEFSVNKSPYAGKAKESTKVTTPAIKARLEKECMTNLALRLEPSASETFVVKGRGTLQLGILMENMRREGYEIMVSAPKVLLRENQDTGKTEEPVEEAIIECPNQHQGTVMEEMQKKGATMLDMQAAAVDDATVYKFSIPTANMIGMQGILLKKCSGEAMVNSVFSHWQETDGKRIRLREKGSIATTATGKVTAYQLRNMNGRGIFFVGAGEEVYEGQVIGQNGKAENLECNITKEKAVSNVRATATALIVNVAPPQVMGLDDYLGFMDTDEILEVTPVALRLCKANSKALKAK